MALGSAVCWAVGQILVKKGFAHIPPLWNNVVNNLLALVFWVPAALWMGGFRLVTPPFPIFLVILSSAALYQLFYYSISKGQLSLTGTIVAVYPVVTVILSTLFLDERLSAFQYTGIAFIIAGGVTVAFPEQNSLPKGAARDAYWFLWGIAGACTIGAGDFLTKVSINRIGSASNIFFLALVLNGLSALNYLVDGKNRKAPALFTRKFRPTFIGICIHLIGAFIFMFSLDRGKISLIGPVSSIYPALMAVLAVKFLGERISLKHGFGIGVTMLGLILIGISGA